MSIFWLQGFLTNEMALGKHLPLTPWCFGKRINMERKNKIYQMLIPKYKVLAEIPGVARDFIRN
jgi:hypothetical protein